MRLGKSLVQQMKSIVERNALVFEGWRGIFLRSFQPAYVSGARPWRLSFVQFTRRFNR